MRDRVAILGVEIDNTTQEEVLNKIDQVIKKKGGPAFVVTPNVDHVVQLQNNDEFRAIYKNAFLVLADGVPLIWASKFLGTPIKEKISGSDLFPVMCEHAAHMGHRLFFLGGREGAADGAAAVLKLKYPDIIIAGTYCPPFGFENDADEESRIVKMIKKSRPDILFVGLGAPKQEKWIAKHLKELTVPVSLGIGVTFEFTCGMVKRAPVWMQRSGLEWFWRLCMEPGRLWKRYLVDDMKFFYLVLKQKMIKNKS